MSGRTQFKRFEPDGRHVDDMINEWIAKESPEIVRWEYHREQSNKHGSYDIVFVEYKPSQR